MHFKIEEHRREKNYTRAELTRRVIWGMCQPLFQWSPRFFYEWRNTLLRWFGAKVGNGVRIYPTARIFAPWALTIEDSVTIGGDVDIYNIGPITIGCNSIISQHSQLCAGSHNFRKPSLPLLRCPIQIGSNVWICADAFIGPGVTVSEGAVVGARASVFSDVESGAVVGGNPARVISMREPSAPHNAKAAA